MGLLAAVPPRPRSLPPLTPARGARGLRVGFLEGCVNRWIFGHVNEAAARLLAQSGCDVVAPAAQRCCGALHVHSGDLEGARRLARTNIEAFEAAGTLDAIVVTAAGCGSAMKEYGALFENDPAWKTRAERFAAKVKDALELLAELGPLPIRREVRASLAYHDACHLAHAQRIRSQPRALLASVPGLELVPLAEADRCCGSAGIYNVLHPEVASVILQSKLERLRDSGASWVAAANPGCLLHIAAGARRAGSRIRAVHPLEVLDEACREEQPAVGSQG
jgi:glycolate oxidase iron-sulfur subunit